MYNSKQVIVISRVLLASARAAGRSSNCCLSQCLFLSISVCVCLTVSRCLTVYGSLAQFPVSNASLIVDFNFDSQVPTCFAFAPIVIGLLGCGLLVVSYPSAYPCPCVPSPCPVPVWVLLPCAAHSRLQAAR